MNPDDPIQRAKQLALDALRQNEPTSWFEDLYAAAARGEAVVPWDRGSPNRLLVEWVERQALHGEGRRALVVGCGLGDDAEYVAGLGFATVAFDVAESAARAARERYPESTVEYRAADLLNLPAEWRGGFDLVVESLTVQSLPPAARQRAIAGTRDTVAPGGTLLVIASGRAGGTDPAAGPPWPLDRADIDAFAAADELVVVRIEDIHQPGPGSPFSWRAEFRRAPAAS